MSSLHFLPTGGRFSHTRTDNFVEAIQREEVEKVGPADYHPIVTKSFERLPEGGRFQQSNSKSLLEWEQYRAAQIPGPGEYAPKALPSDGGVINKDKSKTNIEQIIYDAEQLPGPGQYEHKSMPLPQGGRVSKSNARSEFEETIHRGSQLPGPGEYDYPRWPSPSHGRYASPTDAKGMVDHLHRPPPDGEDPGPRPMPSLDIYRDGTFRLAPKELEQTMRSNTKKLAKAGKKEKIMSHQDKDQFAQARIRAAQKKGEGTAEDAINAIFDHLSNTKSKVRPRLPAFHVLLTVRIRADV